MILDIYRYTNFRNIMDKTLNIIIKLGDAKTGCHLKDRLIFKKLVI